MFSSADMTEIERFMNKVITLSISIAELSVAAVVSVYGTLRRPLPFIDPIGSIEDCMQHPKTTSFALFSRQ